MALAELFANKQKGLPIAAAKKQVPSNVINLMDALRQSLASDKAAKPAKAPRTAKTPPAKKAAAKNRKAS
jgi:DNA end-binding protein Ku